MHRRWYMLVLVASAVGCVWRSYGTIVQVHLDVLMEMTDKLCSVVASGRGPTAEGMAEYVYPGKRAREFLRQFDSYSDRPSYRQFGAFVERYEALVHGVDAARAQGRLGSEELAHLQSERDALRALAAEVRADLKKED